MTVIRTNIETIVSLTDMNIFTQKSGFPKRDLQFKVHPHFLDNPSHSEAEVDLEILRGNIGPSITLN